MNCLVHRVVQVMSSCGKYVIMCTIHDDIIVSHRRNHFFLSSCCTPLLCLFSVKSEGGFCLWLRRKEKKNYKWLVTLHNLVLVIFQKKPFKRFGSFVNVPVFSSPQKKVSLVVSTTYNSDIKSDICIQFLHQSVKAYGAFYPGRLLITF